jgi:hypothetical protein
MGPPGVQAVDGPSGGRKRENKNKKAAVNGQVSGNASSAS